MMQKPVSKWRLIAAFAAIYLIWGSTYLFIRFAIETVPPFLMAGTRFLISGAMLYALSRARGAPAPLRVHWKSTAIVGGLLLFGGNGGVVWAEQLVPSGLAAVLVAMVPLWMVLLDWLRPGGVRPNRGIALGLALGLAGLVLLVRPGQSPGENHIDPLGVGILVLASLSWAVGSLYARHASLPHSPLLSTGMEMLAGGGLLLLAGTVTNEWSQVRLDAISLRSALALVYLIVFGAFIAFTAYTWLLKVSTPAHVSTYAFVNPVVAVFLGWALAGEPLTETTIAASAIIVAAVALITLYRTRPAPPAENILEDLREEYQVIDGV